MIQASEELGELGAVAAGAALKLAKGGLTSPTRYSAEAAVAALSKFHRAEATLSATRQEILDGLVACLQAKERATAIQASVELGALGAAAVAAVPKPVRLGWSRKTTEYDAEAAVKATPPRPRLKSCGRTFSSAQRAAAGGSAAPGNVAHAYARECSHPPDDEDGEISLCGMQTTYLLLIAYWSQVFIPQALALCAAYARSDCLQLWLSFLKRLRYMRLTH